MHKKLFGRRRAAAPARRARQIPLAEADHEEVVRVCAEALLARWGWMEITGTRITRAGLIVRTQVSLVAPEAGYVMADALAPIGYVAEPYQAHKGACSAVLVTGTDPLHRLDGRAAENIEEAI